MTLFGSQALVDGDCDPEQCQDPITKAIVAVWGSVDLLPVSSGRGLLRSASVDRQR